MIDIIKQTPMEYSSQSRDYQVLARLYTALFNVSKSYIDNLQIWTNDIDNKLATLRAKTLNFDIKRAWDENDLEAVTDCFKFLMRNKGTLKALEYCVNILMKIQGIVGETLSEPISINDYTITIRIPETLLTLGVLEDLLSHILPAGYIFNIIRYRSPNLSGLLNEELYYEDKEIRYEAIPYNKTMYVSPSRDKVLKEELVEEEVRLKNSDKYWLYLKENKYVPDDDLTYGLDSAGLIIDDDFENPIELSKEDDKEVALIYPKYKRDEFRVNEITDTFVYKGTDELGPKPVIIKGDDPNYEEWDD